MTKGEKLNNPGDIELSPIKWQGKVTPSLDHVFETFSAPEYGIRAIVKLLLTDSKESLNTVKGIIYKYAPASENDTASYIANVCKALNVTEDEILDVTQYKTMFILVKAIIKREDGEIIYSDDLINKSLSLAGINNVQNSTST